MIGYKEPGPSTRLMYWNSPINGWITFGIMKIYGLQHIDERVKLTFENMIMTLSKRVIYLTLIPSMEDAEDSKWNSLKSILIMFRPEDVEIRDDGQFEGRIKWLETTGSVKKITLESRENTIIVEKRNYHKSGVNYAIGDRIRFMIDMSEVHVIEN